MNIGRKERGREGGEGGRKEGREKQFGIMYMNKGVDS
jgi:hypothetical protein